ncbi:hypothetical protein BV898_07362 [Hypsibius exemplaris]|uniref:Uncharacterized protein n=1 Tax=Hypsibius exemplaris TaxID=2072580 RepID=A0A1W0WTK5_HYPEX|nr:hypothetical protein BV898_07362 [Hypsibius exemplaris]
MESESPATKPSASSSRGVASFTWTRRRDFVAPFLHFLADTEELLKQDVKVDVQIAGFQAPDSSFGVVYFDETSKFRRAAGGSARMSRAMVREEVIVQPEYEDDAVDMDRDDDGHLLMKQDAKGGWSEVQFEAEPANLGSDEEEDGGGGRRGGRKQAMATTRIDSHGRRLAGSAVLSTASTVSVRSTLA